MVASPSPSASCVSSTTITVPLAACVEELWPALKNAVNVIAEYCPQFIQSCNLLHGDGGPGSIRLVKFGPASGLVTYAKEEIIEVDDEKMVVTYLLLEGDLKKQFKVFKPTLSLERVARSGKGHGHKEKEEVAKSENFLQGEVVRSDKLLDKKEGNVLMSESVHKEEREAKKVASGDEERQGAPEGGSETLATWRLEYEVEEGMPPPQIELLNEGAKMFLKLLEASLEALKSQAKLKPTSPIPLKEEAPSPTPLVA